MDITYAVPKVITPLVHKHAFRLEIVNGKITAVCHCGEWFDYLEIIRRINADGMR